RRAVARNHEYSNCRTFQVFHSSWPRPGANASAARATVRGSKIVNRSKQMPRIFGAFVGCGAFTAPSGLPAHPERAKLSAATTPVTSPKNLRRDMRRNMLVPRFSVECGAAHAWHAFLHAR